MASARGIDDDIMGHWDYARVVLVENENIIKEEIQKELRKHLSDIKLPGIIEFSSMFLKTAWE